MGTELQKEVTNPSVSILTQVDGLCQTTNSFFKVVLLLLLLLLLQEAMGIDLLKMQPSAQEVADAKTIISQMNQKEKKSSKSCLVHFLKANPCEALQGGERGAVRNQILETFIVWQSRQKDAKKRIMTTQQQTDRKSKFIEHHWWAREKMDLEIGPIKAESWRASKILTWRPDVVTGSTEDEMVEYAVPVHWERCTEEELKQLMMQTTAEVTEEDANQFANLLQPLELVGSPAASSNSVAIKKEKVPDDGKDSAINKVQYQY